MKINIINNAKATTKEDILYRINYLKAQNEKLSGAKNKDAIKLTTLNKVEIEKLNALIK